MKTNIYPRTVSTKLLCFIVLLAYPISSLKAQTVNQWAWVSGDTLSGSSYLPVYGIKGTPAAANKPGGRNSAVTWTTSGNPLWLFGGYGYGAKGTGDGPDYLGDLWSYNTNTGQWTWVSGSNNTVRSGLQTIYGKRGVAAATNMPGPRNGSATWRDAAGNLWMFGGSGYAGPGSAFSGTLNDLWKFDIALKQWIWVRGDSITDVHGVYGTKAVEAAANKPGGRGFSLSWTDAAGNLWLMGGYGIGSTNLPESIGPLNDLWKYNQADSQWTWVSGSNVTNPVSVYGSLNVTSATSVPGGRSDAAGWKDASGNFWLMGGYGNNTTTAGGNLNDLWQYNISTGLWIWRGGTNTLNAPGVYGTKGTAAAANHPGARNGATSWTDLSGNFWVMGGIGNDATAASAVLNDFWKFTAGTGLWTWVGGSNVVAQNGVYGSENVPAANNIPGARDGQVNWIDANGNLWIFGGGAVYITPYQTNVVNGGSYSTLTNDLWGYQLNTTIPVVAALLALPARMLRFSAAPSGSYALLNWQMTPDQGSKSFDIQRSPDGAAWQSIGTVAASEYCSEACSYQFTDRRPLSVNYYRLQETSVNGQLQYSRVETLSYSADNKLTWYVAGNQAVTVQLLHGNREPYRLTGMDGRVWQQGLLQNGRVTIRQLPRGVYIIQVMTPAGSKSEKIMI